VLGKHILEPNEKTELKIIYHTADRPGAFQKNIIVATSARGQEEVELSMTGMVRELPGAKIQITPRKHDVGSIKAGAVVKLEYKVSNTGLQPLMISKIYSQERQDIYFESNAQAKDLVIDPGKTESIKIEIKPSRPGPFIERIIVSSNAKNASKGNYIIMVNGNVE
jgi:hypothetical protein